MKIVGIICEYNPFHNGHARQLRLVRQLYPDCAIVCAMSGSFVQRGYPAVYHRSLRAGAAVACGADLVLELPVQTALSSAEGFAAGGVRLLGQLCDTLCFGSETADAGLLMDTAQRLLSVDFSRKLKQELERGLSFPAARQRALGDGGAILEKPNDILAVEYCKAILAQGLSMTPLPIRREGGYHDLTPDEGQPSATSLRALIEAGQDVSPYVPPEAAELFAGAPVHRLAAGERAMLYRLRTMTDEEFEALPYGSEGLWRKLMREARRQPTLEAILTAVKSKRYTRTRLDRMVMCAFLGITADLMDTPPEYSRVLAFSDRGRSILNAHRDRGIFINVGEAIDHPQWALEQRCESLYALFADQAPEAPDGARQDRVAYRKC